MLNQGYDAGLQVGAQFKPNSPPGLGNDLDMSVNRLGEIALRLEAIADSLYGSRPEPTGGSAGAVMRPVVSLASRARDIAEMISRVEAAVNRIGEAL